jgi:protocatechuate 4,5-dioxygenase alpha chain
MSVNMVEKLLYDVSVSRAVAERFNTDLDGLLGKYRLNDEEREMVRAGDVRAMRDLGANSMLTMGFWMMVHGPRAMGEYMKRMRRAEG